MRNPLPVARKVVIRVAARAGTTSARRHGTTSYAAATAGWSLAPRSAEGFTDEQPDMGRYRRAPAGRQRAGPGRSSSAISTGTATRSSGLARDPGRAAGGAVVRDRQKRKGLSLNAVEIGDGPEARCIVIAQTSQPSEFGCTPVLQARSITSARTRLTSGRLRENVRFRFVPMTNPDGQLLGLTVSDTQGHFPVFEADRAVQGLPDTRQSRTLWNYLVPRSGLPSTGSGTPTTGRAGPGTWCSGYRHTLSRIRRASAPGWNSRMPCCGCLTPTTRTSRRTPRARTSRPWASRRRRSWAASRP